MRVKSLFRVFAAFRRHINMCGAKLLRDLLKLCAIPWLYYIDSQRPLQATTLQRLLPACRIVA